MVRTNPDAHTVDEISDDYDVSPQAARRMTIRLNHADHAGTVVLAH